MRLLFSKIDWNKVNDCCFTDCIKEINIGMQMDIYESIWLKLGEITDTIVFYILILV